MAAARRAALVRSQSAFARRAAAIDLLELRVIDPLWRLEEDGRSSAALHALHAQAVELRRRWEGTNERLLSRLRDRIRAKRFTPAGLTRAFHRLASTAGRDSYDALDLLIGGLLGAGDLPDQCRRLEAGMVAYQPTPARRILELIDRAGLRHDDVLIDLGSGLGSVVILVALLTDARAVGVEREPSFVEYARRSAAALGASRAEFVNADAREAPLVEGTVFFLYTPFRGRMLQQVLERVRLEASSRRVRICSYGPCTAEIGRAGWLAPSTDQAFGESNLVFFEPAP